MPDGGGSDICLFERRATAETLIYSDYRECGKLMPLWLTKDEAFRAESVPPERLAELREKYDPDKDVGIFRNTALRYARDAGCTVLWDETTLIEDRAAIEDRAVIVELLDMLEAKDKGIRPKITAVRYLALKKKYGPGSNIATVETEDGCGDYISTNWADEAVDDINELLDVLRAKKAPIADERIRRLRLEYGCIGLLPSECSLKDARVILNLCDDIEKARAESDLWEAEAAHYAGWRANRRNREDTT